MSNYLKLLSFSRAFAKVNFKEISSDDIRIEFEKRYPGFDFCNLPNVMREMQRRKSIKKHGYINSTIPSSKSSVIRTYISPEYSKLQSERKVITNQIKIEL